MPSEKEVQKLVDHWVQYCIEYIESGRKEKRKTLKGIDKDEIESHAGEKCPTCTEKMVPQPHTGRVPRRGDLPEKHGITAEHIVPRVLGGDNRRLNLVAMCHRCNQCRNAVMNEITPHLPTIRGSKLVDSVRDILSRYIEWSIRTIHTPKSKKIDAHISDLFEKEKIADDSRQPSIIAKAKRRAAKNSKKQKPIASDEMLEVLKEILETQKAILERLQKSPLRRFGDWIFGFIPSKKPRPQIDSRLKKHEERKRKRRRNRRDGTSEKKEKTTPSNQNHLETKYKYFCPECQERFRKWHHALTHKSETGHCSHICDDCSSFLLSDKRKNEHEIQTGHTSFSGNYFSQQQMSIKHYNPDNSFSKKLSLTPTRKVAEIESLATPPKQVEIKQIEDEFPIVDGLNSSTKGFRFPRYPRQLADALIWFEHNHQLYPTTVEIKSAMNVETELARTRVNYLITKLGNIVKPKNQGGISSADWTTGSNMPAIDILDALQTFVYQIYLEKQIEITHLHTEYFSQARNHISGKTEEE
jgi:hypothetical protein